MSESPATFQRISRLAEQVNELQRRVSRLARQTDELLAAKAYLRDIDTSSAGARRAIRSSKRRRATALTLVAFQSGVIVLGVLLGSWLLLVIGVLGIGSGWAWFLTVASALDRARDDYSAALTRESEQYLRDAA